MPNITAMPKRHNLNLVHRDRGYRHTDRDPIMEELCDWIYKSEKTSKEISLAVTRLTGGGNTVTAPTINNWLNGKTRTPQNAKMDLVGLALNIRRGGWTKMER